MIQLPNHIQLSQQTLIELAGFQQLVNQAGSYAQQVAEAKKQFKLKNTKKNKTFKVVKKGLSDMCSGARRCCYCEDSLGDEVEHIHPKDFYPNLVFDWMNYLYACGPCNSPKGNKFEIFDLNTGQIIDLTQQNPANIPTGEPLLINPRTESGMAFMMLDLDDTFIFVPLPSLNAKDKLRAERTIALLHLSDRDELQEARRNAYIHYYNHLFSYVKSKETGATQPKLDKIRRSIQREHHPSVWFEMKRYFTNNWLINIDPELHDLFEKALVDDVLNW